MNRDDLPIDAFDFLWLELTARCNLECVHCYADSGPLEPLHGEMQMADWTDVIDQAADLGCRSVQFIGGEPTLHPGLGALIEHCRARGVGRVEVYTNGTTLTDMIKRQLSRCAVDLAFSVYAADATVHDTITRRRGSLAKTLSSIRWALDANLEVRASVVAMQANADHVDRIVELLRNMGVRSVGVDEIRGIGRASRQVIALEPMKELCGACGRGQLCVTPDGNIYPCVFSRFCPVGSVKTGLSEAIRGQRLSTFRSALRLSRAESRIRSAQDVGNHEPARLQCNPEMPAPPCRPENDPGPCNPEKPAPPCAPEIDPGPCRPETARRALPPRDNQLQPEATQ